MNAWYTRDWTPADSPRGYVVVVHGYGEHSGRYAHLATALTAIGLGVHAYDHEGHGQTGGKRGYIRNFDALVDGLVHQIDGVCSGAAGLPVFLFAHSMGGLVACTYLAQHRSDLAGAVISSPLLAIPDGVSPWLLRVAQLLSTLTPWLPVDRLDPTHISRIATEVDAYNQDPLVYHGPIVARTGAELTGAIARVSGQFAAIDLPLLVLHGMADRLAPPAGGQCLFDEAVSSDKTGVFPEEGYHELLNDVGGDAILQTIVEWYGARLS